MGTVVILAIGFSLLLRSPSLGTSFLLFYASGYMPLHIYQTVSMHTARALRFSRPLFAYPSVTWIDAILARFLLNSLTGAMVTYLVLTLILATTETRIILNAPAMIWSCALAAFLGLGVGTLNCAMLGLSETWDQIWSILTRPLFLASCIFYTFEELPRTAQTILWWNPLVHITGYMRTGLYPMYHPDYVSLVYVLMFAIIPLMAGALLMWRYHKTILNL